MTNSEDVRKFLASRRARLTPDEAGLPAYGGDRRVKGLRREEVAMLAGMSIDYYIRLERGNLSGASDSVLEALARALQLDDAETAHLFDLARASTAAPRVRRKRSPQTVRPSVQRVIDAITSAPAWVRNDRGDVLASNELGRALYLEMMLDGGTPPNSARFTFLSPRAREFFADWERAADDIVAVLRSTAGKNPYDKDLSDLIGELSTRSEEFRVRWARHDVKYHRTGRKRLHHSIVGDLDLTYEAMELPADPGLRVNIYTAEPGSPSEDALKVLASWAATQRALGAAPEVPASDVAAQET
ncbi:helix-turn-helix domain-containing protein [Pseudarthrobacter sp. NIBRBAC000502770]|uniref:helix-turn-helix domain-containing protein n=1 Tax=Pseudarthrobacter sp. NIBRBAC000502770 TaxID=2590785 RepID=UPI0011408E63|nr:helix-turn-helix transcriptional regulator [Pseudarthrobacter sp. NIBRBAC000502770]QDG89442.1 helix-turn-helix domain-containing protein [Pseudarthrobacter sp. NIBRBAC000502770]